MRLKPNQMVELVVFDTQQVYQSRVEDVSENEVLVAAPSHQGVIIPMRVNSAVHIVYHEDNPKYEGRYRALATLIRRVKGNLPCLLFRIEGPWERIQNRDYVRVDVLLDGALKLINDNDDIQFQDCTIKNISGGGLIFIFDDSLNENDLIKMKVLIEDKTILVKGRIVRKINEENSVWYYGMVFVDIDEKVRQELIRFVYKRQLELHRKGLR